ncbi:N-acetyl-alpha-D-glucosaminyl L-malate synthase BshA [Prosthecochloris sp. N3]|uniref:N-acetyl-alpha-D-glucosaminyl L-malate synthase BshA n=1 Tax=Prosthecochloris ethylica TaxID=2743976 RepID=A0ABR9XU42_9CHLB|nr:MULTISPECIES: N-acetyl-alpha-D-glucosaminyl L-malate synthase BshA [Prosthecochloris]MBF0587016.1 N-acetyl-alpha-D-glucosaminyl L-malate synthase BshA [Prosthecochloris ethylica]MBF0637388.1 N-acetyl-alpha-D-glucosaminyl L-malate synthase BshA [Prosthecochloris ethylica]NUK48144.1 N-acetyl-alpha-D-glucosaminyl L-malate synthase BshA [Prosthecochloris ethylica]RNA65282.1 N-acetyl-alpha-D-glucosaminyl L-malate synthase BshA [Prosthecochloris sp. ZM_2]
MKIGISCHHTYGGSGAVATELGKALAARGHVVHFINRSAPFRLGSFTENIYYHEVEAMHYPLFECPFYSLALASKIAEVAMFEKLDIVHAHYAIPHAMSAMLARQMVEDRCRESSCFRIATTLHGTDITVVGADASMQGAVRLAINKSDGVTTVSEYLKRETERLFEPRVPIEVIANFVDTREFQRQSGLERLERQLGLRGEKICIHLSNFRPVKRIGDVLSTFSRVLERVPATLLMVGDGPERSEAEVWVREHGIAGHVRFLGKIDDIVPLLSLADVMLMPSNAESFGLAALEAMACGVPVVVTDAGGFPEFVEHGRHGYLVAPGEVEEMARCCLELLLDDEQHRRMAEACIRQAERYRTSVLVEQYEDFYERLLAGRS